MVDTTNTFELSQQSWKYPTKGTKVCVGVTVGVTVRVGVIDLVGVGVGGGQTLPTQTLPILIVTEGSVDEGLFPQKYKIVSGDIIVLINSPLQSINEMV